MIASRIQNRIRKNLAKLENELQVRANVGIVLCGEELLLRRGYIAEAEKPWHWQNRTGKRCYSNCAQSLLGWYRR